MLQPLVITSTQNPRIKRLMALSGKSAERRDTGLIVVEGRRELFHCVCAGGEVQEVYCCPSLYDANCAEGDVLSLCRGEHFEVSPTVYNHMAYRGGTEGIIAIVKPRLLTLNDLRLSQKPLIMVLESVEKPGNLGAVLRSADAAPADAVIVCDPLTDLYNPNTVRSSMGSIFTVPCVACTSQQCIDFLISRDIQILTAQLQDSRPYYDTDMCRGTALVMGTEATGLTDAWRRVADAHIRIPMNGSMDSLNVSVSAAILLFEAARQRRAGTPF
ncbi:MAG: RNA methyltransferase [Muribaculaceae bacterium]|nr:RNA methyltransferase [Muribaculaceae bacterium]